MAGRAAEEPAEYVAAALVRGQHAVRDQEGDRPCVIADDAHRDVVVRGAAVRLLREALDARDDAAEHVDVVVRRDVLHDGREPLEAHPGVDVLRRKVGELPALVAVVLDEDEVPDLDVARAPRVHAADVRGVVPPVARRGPAVDVDLGARPARARVAHLPEVLGVEPEDAVAPDVGDLAPELLRLVVGRVHRRPEPILRQLPHPCEKLPGPRDRLPLVVVAERPVPEHLEEGVVVGVAAHLLEIVVLAADAEALLRIHGAAVRARVLPEEHLLELHHARVDEQQARVVLGNQRGARHDGVPALPEEVEEAVADLVAGHYCPVLPARPRSGNRPAT